MRPNGVLKAIMISKPQSYLASKRSRHQRSDGDCALSLGTPVASRNGHVGHTIWPHGQSPLPESRIRVKFQNSSPKPGVNAYVREIVRLFLSFSTLKTLGERQKE